MSSTFIISDKASLTPGGSTFGGITGAIGLAIAGDEPTLAKRFIQVAEWNDVFINISDVSVPAFKAITNAVKAIQIHLVTEEPTKESTERVYGLLPGAVEVIAELKVALLLDPRAEYTSQGMGKIIVNHSATWEAIEWMYDFVLETLLGCLHTDSTHLFSMLVDDWVSQHRELDLRDLNGKDFVKLQPAIEYLFARYRDAGVRRLKCDAFLEPFAPKIIDLHRIFKSDHRLRST